MNTDLNSYLKQFINPKRLNLIEEKLSCRTRYITIVLENLYQPHNASAVIRTCDCFGIQDVHIIENNNKFVANDEIALGAEQWLSINRYNQKNHNTKDAINALKANGYKIVATSSNLTSTPIEDYNIENQKTAFVFGTELTGISEDVINMADKFVTIPMYGFTESLNISVAAAIILHFISWKIRNSGINWKLSDEEMQTIELQWLKNSIKKPELIEKHYLKHIKLNPNTL